jgi:3',5'-cyclic AMP phosphodiesterase CpdA
MTEFRLTQISDTHLARRHQPLTDNFHHLCEYIDQNRPDLVVNSGDLAFDAPTNADDLAFARELHAGLPAERRALPGNHDIGDNPTATGPVPPQPATEAARAEFSFRLWRRLLALRGRRLVFHRAQFADHEHRACLRGRAV